MNDILGEMDVVLFLRAWYRIGWLIFVRFRQLDRRIDIGVFVALASLAFGALFLGGNSCGLRSVLHGGSW